MDNKKLDNIKNEAHTVAPTKVNPEEIEKVEKDIDFLDECVNDKYYVTIRTMIEETGKPYDIDKIRKAFVFARESHKGQLRKSGDPYILHPVAAATILIELGMDTDSIVAALLHDVVEDTPATSEDVKKIFGGEVALLVDGVTKLNGVPFTSRERQQAENVRKMLFAVAQDVRVIIIKLADRLHNMRTLEYQTEEKKRLKALETMEVYAPLAHRLGMSAMKQELEDLAIRYLDPVACVEIEKQLTLCKDERQKFIDKIIARIGERLQKENVKAHIFGRVKSTYGIYRKEFVQGKAFDEIYDVYAVRVIVDSVMECYNVLGIIHDMMRPIPNRFKDYISTPKQNMYQSLHTTVIDKEGIPFEVQIRTWEMHYTAEYGVAAHWKYKLGMNGKNGSLDEKLTWVRQLLDSQKESDDVEDIVKSIKTDIAADEVFVFTPRGDVISLPVGSTVVDFAYAIHSQVGNKTVGGKVDGRMVALDYQLKTGNICEIITSNNPNNGPSRDWLNIVKTSEARNKIRAWFKKEKREENIAEGKAALEKEFHRNLIALPESDKEAFLLELANRQRFNTVEDFWAAIGYGGVSLQKIIPRVKEDFHKKYRQDSKAVMADNIIKKTKSKTSSGVIVEGLEGCLVKFSKCCTPLPGDEIVGFVTRGFGVSVHKKDCVNVTAANIDPERLVKCSWATATNETFKSTIEVLGEDRPGFLANVSMVLSNMKVQINTLLARELKNDKSSIQATISIKNLEQLNTIMTALRKISGVESVDRIIQ